MSGSHRICVVGLWHLGSVLSACWAEAGNSVIGFDDSSEVVAGLQAGKAPIYEPGLDDLIRMNLEAGRLSFCGNLAEALADAEFIFIGYDTPVDQDNQADLAPVERAIRRAAPLARDRTVLIVSSQVPIGTCARWREVLREVNPGAHLELAYSPENLMLGEAISRYSRPDRIVVGADSPEVQARLDGLFSMIGAPLLRMSLASAEMAKHAINGFLATSVSFINEISSLCEATGADVLSVSEALRSDIRIGKRAFLSPGLGFSGVTLERDIRVLQGIGSRKGAKVPVLDGVLAVNQERPAKLVERLRSACGFLRGQAIGFWGLTYKAGTSTLRGSVSLQMIASLAGEGARVIAHDPKADLRELEGPLSFEFAPDPYEAVKGADALLVVTGWPEFRGLDFQRVKSLMKQPLILDANNSLAGLPLKEMGFRYLGVGR